MRQVTISLIKVRSCNALLPVCICTYLKSVLRYKIILVAYPLDTVFTFTRIWGSVVIFQSQREQQAKSFRNTGLEFTACSTFLQN